MYHFFAPQGSVEDGFLTITGPDVKHITRVLRMEAGEEEITEEELYLLPNAPWVRLV